MNVPKLYTDLEVEGFLKWENDAQFFADALNIVEPKNILETGFFRGASTFIFLYMTDATITSVDPMCDLHNPGAKHDGNESNVKKLQVAFPNRLTFLKKDSALIRDDIRSQKFDLFFIDGDHAERGIRNDFKIAVEWDIPWLLVDDFVTDVLKVYQNEFRDEYFPVRIYPRKDMFMGQPIPIVLLRRINKYFIAKRT